MNLLDTQLPLKKTGLNEQQNEAVLTPEGPFLVLAGAGSGKTRVLTQRISHLVSERGISPDRIMAVTFTNKAAKEMKQRLETLQSGFKRLSTSWIGTFHGLCNRFLRMEIQNISLPLVSEKTLQWSKNFVIFDTSDSLSLIKECLQELNIDEKSYQPKQIQGLISNLKNQSITPLQSAKSAKDALEQRFALIYNKYQDKLSINNAVDFDDLLLFTLLILKNEPAIRKAYAEKFMHILVDEFQDTNQTQYHLLRCLTDYPDTKNRDWTDRSFCAVGDVDQSIYSWRGADYRLALNFVKDFPEAKVIKLEQNYRSKEPILLVANTIISNNEKRIDKKLVCTRGDGEKVTCFEASDEIEEATFVASEIKRLRSKGIKPQEIAVLYRVNALSRALEEALLKSQISYKIIGGMRFYDRLEIKDLLAYLRLIYNSKDSTALKRVINVPRRGIGPSTISQIEENANRLGFSLYAALSDLLDAGGLGPKITQSAHQFVELIDQLIEKSEELTVPDLLKRVIDQSGYLLALEATGTDESESRIENIYELLNVAQQFHEESEDKSLGAFLSQVSLVSDADENNETEESVTLLSVHASKGLEYPIVFITGLEEGIFPHSRSLINANNSKEELEEERRLMYVAVTRAEDKLFLTFARRRRLWGQREFAEPSRFLSEIPKDQTIGYWGQSVFSKTSDSAIRSVNKINSQPEPPSRKEPPKAPEVVFTAGDKVNHKTFGNGIVQGLFGGKGQKFYSVLFEGVDGKKLLSGESLRKI
jgi:DNA helicase-2/ATP-dependent DNA helicase PcrA